MAAGEHVIIIGNGIAGITAARHIRKYSSDTQITVISSESKHFYSRTALMYIYMGHMKYENTKPYEDFFWAKNDIGLLYDHVQSIDFKEKKLHLNATPDLRYDKLILAVGSTPNKFGWKGEQLEGVSGMYGLQDLEKIEKWTKDATEATIVGGGLIGIELAEMLHSRHIPVHFLVRESDFWNNVLPPGESRMITRHIRKQGIDLRLETELKEIIPDHSGRASAVMTSKGDTFPSQFVGLTTGVRPNIDFLKDSELATDRGIKVNLHFETNQPGVYAIGDCVQFPEAPGPGRKPIEQVWYTARMHGETLAYSLYQEKTAYKPSVWFNSAKFFNIEYQVYGVVNPQPAADEIHVTWENTDHEKFVRFIFHKSDRTLKGVNVLGLRFRHAQCEQMIKQGWTPDLVYKHLKQCYFEPEFHKKYHRAIKKAFRNTFDELHPITQKLFSRQQKEKTS